MRLQLCDTYNLTPAQVDNLGVSRVRELTLGMQARAYVQEQQREDNNTGGRSKRNSKKRREFYNKYATGSQNGHY